MTGNVGQQVAFGHIREGGQKGRTVVGAALIAAVLTLSSFGGMAAASPARGSSAPPAKAACKQWIVSGVWKVRQSNTAIRFTFRFHQRGTKLTGRANFSSSTGTIRGTLKGKKLSMVVNFSPTVMGRYTAVVTSRHMRGRTHQIGTPSNHATWSATGRTTCKA